MIHASSVACVPACALAHSGIALLFVTLRAVKSFFAAALGVALLVEASLAFALETPAYFQPLNMQTLFAPSQSSPERIQHDEAINVYRNLDLDEFMLSGFVASRRLDSAVESVADYRTYLGLRYRDTIADSIQVSGHTFYGAGTYDGDNSAASPKAGALPEEVRADGKPIGEWLGADWQLKTKLFDRQSVQASIEYRQPLSTHLFDEARIFGLANAEDPAAHKSVGFNAGSSLAVGGDVALLTRLKLANDSAGYEVGLDRQPQSGIRTGVSYAVQQISDPLAATSAATVERRLTKVNVGVPFLSNRFSTAFELQYNAVSSPLLVEGRRNFVVGNLTVASAPLARDTKISFGMQNVFDTRGVNADGQAIPFLPQDGRSVRFDLKRTF